MYKSQETSVNEPVIIPQDEPEYIQEPVQDKRVEFEELTLWQVFILFLYHPLPTLSLFFQAIALPVEERPRRVRPEVDLEYEYLPPTEESLTAPIPQDTPPTPAVIRPTIHYVELPGVDFGTTFNLLPIAVLLGLLISTFLAVIGGSRLWSAANDQIARAQGDLKSAPVWFVLAILFYLLTALVASYGWWMALIRRMGGGNAPPEDYEPPSDSFSESETDMPDLSRMDSDEDSSENENLIGDSSTSLPVEEVAVLPPAPLASKPSPKAPPLLDALFTFIENNSLRMALIPPAIFMAFLAYRENAVRNDEGQISQIVFTTPGVTAWVLAIVLWWVIMLVDLNGIVRRIYRGIRARQLPTLQRPQLAIRVGWYHVALLVFLLLAAYFRLHNLNSAPPDMTSDHIEKLKDAVRVSEGLNAIFFENNGGREAFQMYFIALLEKLPGIEFNFTVIKLASIIEGMLTVLAGYWLGKTVMGNRTPEDREMGIWVGLGFAALLAISSWHTMISRLGLRIALTPLTTVLLMIFLARAMRHNRRFDFVMVGFILGAGIYFYQANRMLPVIVVVGVGLAVIFYARHWKTLLNYGINLACAGIMALSIFMPMYRYEQQYPEFFWSRTRGRMFGDNAFVRLNEESGVEERYNPTLREQIDRFLDNSENFEENYINALEMWSWQGDGAWINNPNSRPALDPYTNAFFLLGIAAWGLLILKKLDAVHVLVPVGILIMLLPSALAVNEAIQTENPSFTRSSGTIPFVFLIAAYPLAQLGFYARRVSRYQFANLILAAGLLLPPVALASSVNYTTYFELYPASYSRSWKPYTFFAQPMKVYLDEGGTFGNAFLVGWPHWLDHRIIGATAGDLKWPNGLVDREQVYTQIQANGGTPYEYDPSKPLFFMYNLQDTETREWLSENFPGGTHRVKENVERPELNFGYYIVPAGAQLVG